MAHVTAGSAGFRDRAAPPGLAALAGVACFQAGMSAVHEASNATEFVGVKAPLPAEPAARDHSQATHPAAAAAAARQRHTHSLHATLQRAAAVAEAAAAAVAHTNIACDYSQASLVVDASGAARGGSFVSVVIPP